MGDAQTQPHERADHAALAAGLPSFEPAASPEVEGAGADGPLSAGALAQLVGSRICHDLISPVGAIGNGLELLAMAGGRAMPGGSAELDLIGDSVLQANARIRFFRVAFGLAGQEQRLGRSELRGILSDLYTGGRIRVDWQLEADRPRGAVQIAFLLVLCLETALAKGGQITVRPAGENGWDLRAEGPVVRIDSELWRMLSPGGAPAQVGLRAGDVHFALARDRLREQGLDLHATRDGEGMTLKF